MQTVSETLKNKDNDSDVSPIILENEIIANNISLNPLPFNLYYASIPKYKLKESAADILKLLFFNTNSTNRFVSFTKTDDEISILLDNESINCFTPGTLQVSKDVWRPIQVHEGMAGIYEPSILNTVTTPLAVSGISIFNLCTFNYNFLMVRTSELDKAISCLRDNVFKLNVGDDELQQSVSKANLHMSKHLIESAWFKPYPKKLTFASLGKGNVERNVHPLIRLTLFEEQFFSYTETPEEVSIIMEESSKSLFPRGYLTDFPETLRAVKMCNVSLGFDETGIVNAICTPLAQQKIAMLNLSTFHTNYSLVEEKHLLEALDALSHIFQVVEDDTSKSLPSKSYKDSKPITQPVPGQFDDANEDLPPLE